MSHYSFYSVNVNAGILARQVLYPTYITGPMIHNSTNARRCETAVCTDKPHAHTHTASHTPNQLYSIKHPQLPVAVHRFVAHSIWLLRHPYRGWHPFSSKFYPKTRVGGGKKNSLAQSATRALLWRKWLETRAWNAS